MSNDRHATPVEGVTPERLATALDRIFGGLGAHEVFGPPQAVGDTTVIPAASIQRAGGFGMGGGTKIDKEGAGGGGGGYGEGRPVAVIEVRSSGVRVRPVFDWTRLGLTAVVAGLATWRSLRRGGGCAAAPRRRPAPRRSHGRPGPAA